MRGVFNWLQVSAACSVFLAACGGCDDQAQGEFNEDLGSDSAVFDASSADAAGSPDVSVPAVDMNWDEPERHRSVAEACPMDRPAVNNECRPEDNWPCEEDADCTEGINGRCGVIQPGGCACNYDECFSDSDCGPDAVCLCGDRSRGGQHICVPANCRTDADCGEGSWCAPSVPCFNAQWWIVGYYCTTDRDECGAGDACRIDEEDGSACSSRDGKPWMCDNRCAEISEG